MSKKTETTVKAHNGNDFIADVRRSISAMDNAMKEWHKTLVENSKDNESYSKGLLKGYECAMSQFDNWLKEYCA